MNKNTSFFYRELYKNIDNLRRHHNLTNRDIAITLNVSESFIKNITQARAHYNLEHIFILHMEFNWDLYKMIPNPAVGLNQRMNFNEFYKDFLEQRS